MATQTIQRIARIYRLESQARELTVQARHARRQQYTQPLWNELPAWMKLERTGVPGGGGIASALDHGLKRRGALGRFRVDGAVSVNNSPIENLIQPWAPGR